MSLQRTPEEWEAALPAIAVKALEALGYKRPFAESMREAQESLKAFRGSEKPCIVCGATKMVGEQCDNVRCLSYGLYVRVDERGVHISQDKVWNGAVRVEAHAPWLRKDGAMSNNINCFQINWGVFGDHTVEDTHLLIRMLNLGLFIHQFLTSQFMGLEERELQLDLRYA